MQHSEVTTDRFILRVLTPELVGEDYLRWFSNPEASQYIYYARNENNLNDLKNYVQEKYESTNALFFGIFLKDSEKHIGNIKFEPLDLTQGHSVMGILIGEDDWRGKGVFTEIDSVLVKCLSEMGIKKFYLGVDRANIPAIKAYEKAGYKIDVKDFLNAEVKNSVTMLKEI